MLDVIREAEESHSNTISFNYLLKGVDVRFRQAVIGALIWEGFELNETLPYLQHPLDILRAIAWLETLDFGTPWESFREALLVAGQVGILMDLSILKTSLHQSTSFVQSIPNIGYHLHRLEIA